MKKQTTDYWFTIEPYVFIGLTNQCALLYNTLDGNFLESCKKDVLELLHEVVQKANHGVTLLTSDQYNNESVRTFVTELREKFMGDIIDVNLSKGKPVQLLPFFDFEVPNKLDVYKRHSFSSSRNILENLLEVNIYLSPKINVEGLILFLEVISERTTFNIIGNIEDTMNCRGILNYFNQGSSLKNMVCSYKHFMSLRPEFNNNFSYKIHIDFPIDIQQWEQSRSVLLNQDLPVEYIFDVSSFEDCQKTESFVEVFQIEKYRLHPVYTGKNIRFFEDYVFLSKEDILSMCITIKDLFFHQSINSYDFGKIHILPTGDVYANLNHPMLGNIATDTIYDIVQKEIDNGVSWFNIRNHAPCNNCVYQWLCPSPSDYEIAIGRANLCHIKK